VDVCTTAMLPVRGRTAAWSRLFGTHFEPASFRFEHADEFEADLSVIDLGALRLARLRCGSGRIGRGLAQLRDAGGPTHTLLLQMRGTSTFCHYGQSITLEEGAISLCDGAVPYRLDVSAGSELMLLRVPTTLLKEHLPSPECFCGKLLANDAGLASITGAMAISLFERRGCGLALPYQDRVARHLLDMIATSYAMAFEAENAGSSIVSGRHAAVKLYIEQHLRDPDLRPCSIAARLKLSARYMRMIFATCNETVSAYILRRRLEECARQIGDPSWRGHSMTEIAFGWGFNSAPHFTRSFRDRYDMSPRDYRRIKLEEHGATASTRTATLPRQAYAATQAAA
jgi:AraC family transcriptional activator of tynA and feaB